jgi:molybdopterin molybdotransferase
MNTPVVSVARKPVVAILSTGDELVYPGDTPKDDQIIASNTFGIAALVEEFGGIARVLPIARDTHASIEQGLSMAQDADILVTIGGASVGDHDLVAKVMQDAGGELDFYKIAMRPGKPLMAGRFGSSVMLGLPGNPVSAMVCAHIFLAPLINVCLGLPAAPRPEKHAPLAHDITGNGRREHYMRAQLKDGEIHVASRQDSGLLSVLAGANILIKRPIDAPPAFAGTPVPYIDLHRID